MFSDVDVEDVEDSVLISGDDTSGCEALIMCWELDNVGEASGSVLFVTVAFVVLSTFVMSMAVAPALFPM